MKLEMTPNLEESDIKKEQVLQAEDTFNLNNHQKLQSVKNLPLRWGRTEEKQGSILPRLLRRSMQ